MTNNSWERRAGGWSRDLSILGGLAIFGLILIFGDFAPGKPAVTRTAAVAALMAIWWITEAVPLAVTSLLPVILFPLLGIMSGKAVASQYFNHIIFLFIGGFIVALALERWNLHKRIALRILLLFGVHPRSILLGLMVATAFLSMWISNTATAMMMVTIVLAVITQLEETQPTPAMRRYSVGLLLGVAYAASIGGVATLVGTPPNLSFVRIFEIQFPDAPAISFATWFMFAFPLSFVMLGVTWVYLSWIYTRGDGLAAMDRKVLRQQYDALGPMTFPEAVVLADFALLALLWLFRADIRIGDVTIPGWSGLFGHPDYINDGSVAIGMAMLLFLIPAGTDSTERIMDWSTAARLPWNIVLLFGGGFALAYGFMESGLSQWMGERLAAAGHLSPFLLVGVICLAISFLTELTSNTATAEMILPILAGLSGAIGLNPLLLMVPATLACSFAFMMPVATPPNAIIFGTQRLTIWEMAKVGLPLNLLKVIVILAAIYLLGPVMLGIDVNVMPQWAAR